jgi:hypothetical protein
VTERPPLFAQLKDAFAGAFRYPDWPRKTILQGLWLLVPVAGYFALLGWQRKVYEGLREGATELPEPGFAPYLRGGVPGFFAVATLYVVPMALMLLAELSREVLKTGRSGDELIEGPIIVYVLISYPDALRRTLEKRERIPALRIWPTVSAVRRAPKAFLMVALAMVVAYLLAGAGVYTCLGFFLTAPLGHLIAARIAFVWQRELEV